ncbi:MAG: hypothetical protein JWN04_408, partial [Myxococcaceae bacterium]|nr:hypothetical protein [Myxococcaceae bacterium]
QLLLPIRGEILLAPGNDVLLPGGPGRFASRGSHRSGRAEFPHPAPRSAHSLRGIGTHDSRTREGETLQQRKHAFPGDVPGVRAAAKPLVPGTSRLAIEAIDALVVRRDAEVAIATAKLLRETLLLRAHGFVSMFSTPRTHSA